MYLASSKIQPKNLCQPVLCQVAPQRSKLLLSGRLQGYIRRNFFSLKRRPRLRNKETIKMIKGHKKKSAEASDNLMTLSWPKAIIHNNRFLIISYWMDPILNSIIKLAVRNCIPNRHSSTWIRTNMAPSMINKISSSNLKLLPKMLPKNPKYSHSG